MSQYDEMLTVRKAKIWGEIVCLLLKYEKLCLGKFKTLKRTEEGFEILLSYADEDTKSMEEA